MTGLAYGLWQHNQYLVWFQDHPGHVRQAGPLSDQLSGLIGWGHLLWLVLLWALVDYFMRVQGLSLRDVFRTTTTHPTPTPQPVGPGYVRLYTLLGLVGLGFGLFLGARTIQDCVWEDSVSLMSILGTVFPLLVFSLGLVTVPLDQHRSLLPTGKPAQPPRHPRDARLDHRYLAALIVAQSAVLALLWLVLEPAWRLVPWAYLVGWSYGISLSLPARLSGPPGKKWLVCLALCTIPPLTFLVLTDVSYLENRYFLTIICGTCVGAQMFRSALVWPDPQE